MKVEGLNGESLNQRQMYLRCNLPIPLSVPNGFELAMPGRKSRFIAQDQFRPFQEVTRDMVLECAGNGRVLMDPVPDGIPWALDGVSAITVSGFRLSEVIGPIPDEVTELVFTGADIGTIDSGQRVPYQFSISKELAQSTVPILGTHIGGEAISKEHGGPIRLFVPGHYAMKSVKWLVRVEGVVEPFRGHFVEKYRYYQDSVEPERAPVDEIAVRSIISWPADGEMVFADAMEIRGSAWSGSSGISMVEVSVDGGDSWDKADLARRLMGGRWAPVRWAYTATPEPGPLQIMARATDEAGATQPLEPRWNANGYANNVVHRVTVEVVEQ